MKIEKSNVTKFNLSELDIDPVTVIIEDTALNQGKIIIECFSESWSACWNAMGGTITEFFCRCDEDYLAKNLSNIKREIMDIDKVNEAAIKSDLEPEDNPSNNLLSSLYGDNFWYDFPLMPNPKYKYICRIINVVKEALKKNLIDPDKENEAQRIMKKMGFEIDSDDLLSDGRDLLTVDGLSKEMADHIGHGMREKCTQHAEVARAFLIAMLESEAIIKIHILRNWSQEKIGPFAKHLLGEKCQACKIDNDLIIKASEFIGTDKTLRSIACIGAALDHAISLKEELKQIRDIADGSGELLGPKHSGMRISANGLMGRIAAGGQVRTDQRYILGEMLKHLEEIGKRYYAGDIKAVDEFLQLYCLDKERA